MHPRPSGHEPDELLDCSTPRYGGSGRNRTYEPAKTDLLLSGQFHVPTVGRFRRRMAQESNLWDPSLGPAAVRAGPHASCGCHPWRDLLESHQRRRFCGPSPELLGQSLMAEGIGIEPTSCVATTCRLPSGSARQLRVPSNGGCGRARTYARLSPCTP